MTSVPLACVPGAIPAEERAGHFERTRRLLTGSVIEREALANGYAFRFSADALPEVAAFVDHERRCCPFLAFEVTVPPAGEAISLRLTGPEGTRAFLDAELGR
jgi:hypothetical protein